MLEVQEQIVMRTMVETALSSGRSRIAGEAAEEDLFL